MSCGNGAAARRLARLVRTGASRLRDAMSCLRKSRDREIDREIFVGTHYRLTRCSDGGIRVLGHAGEVLLRGLRPSYSVGSVHDVAEAIERSERLVLRSAAGLSAGSEILINQPMFGGTAHHRFYHPCRIVAVEGDRIVVDPPLPPHLVRYPDGMIVVRRERRSLAKAAGGGGGSGVGCVTERHASEDLDLTLDYRPSKDTARLEVVVHATARRACRLYHLALTLDTALILRELYLKNRCIHDVPAGKVDEDWWLWREGVRATTDDGRWALVVLHNPELAFVEVVTAGSGFPWKTIEPDKHPAVVANLEHFLAQRFRRHLGSSPGKHRRTEDASLPLLEAGEARAWRLVLHVGQRLPPPPRFMLAAGGHRAVHVWTEHADRTIVESHRAVYLGDERVTECEQAVAGFVFHRHPVTKSIFWDNPTCLPIGQFADGPKPAVEGVVAARPAAAWRRDAGLRALADGLHARGYEICLHTAAPTDQPREVQDAALEDLARRYPPLRTWIDHALDKVRANLSTDGARAHGPCDMRPAWVRHGVRYFWCSASEDYAPKRKDEIDLLHRTSGAYTPTPLYWRMRWLPAAWRIWASNECPVTYYSEESLNRLIRERGVSIHHHYYPYFPDTYGFGFIERGADGSLRIAAAFDRLLATMAQMRDAGELWITTIGALLEYWTALERVTWWYEGRRAFVIENTGDSPIAGFAFVVRAREVRCRQARFASRRVDDNDVLVWLDLAARSRYRFEVDGYGG